MNGALLVAFALVVTVIGGASATRAADVIPVAEVAPRAEEVAASLREIDTRLAADPDIAHVEAELPGLTERLAARAESTRLALEGEAALKTLDALTDSWQSTRLALADSAKALTDRARWLDEERDRLVALRETWSRTRTEAGADTPKEVFTRIDEVFASLTQARARLATRRAEILLLQDRVAQEIRRCEDALALISDARGRATGSLLERDSPPVWTLQRRELRDIPRMVRAGIYMERARVRQFVVEHAARLVLHAVFVLGIIVTLRLARDRVPQPPPAFPTAGAARTVLVERPVAAGILLGLLLAFWIYPDEPRAALALIQIGGFVPVLLLLRALLPPVVLPGAYGLAALFLAEQARVFVSPFPVAERALFIAEMLAAALMLGHVLLSRRDRGLLAGHADSPLWPVLRPAHAAALVCVVIAAIAALLGHMRLARLLGSGVLTSGYLALLVYAGVRLTCGLVSMLVSIRPLRLLRSVSWHRSRIEHLSRTLAIVAGILAWAIGTVEAFGLLAPAVAATRRVLGAPLITGGQVSVGDLLAFVLTIVLSFLASSLLRTVLEDEVFPRLSLPAGVPYALSSLLRYLVIFCGFVVALFVLGLDLDRVTLLGGAFGLGLGFGLQNVVNNFVSGLIVLFERPVRVGDTVEIGTVQGEVRRIGIRSSTVRTGEGADVIVPNSMLVAEKVTNWTPFNPVRRIDIPVRVADGTATEEVLEVLVKAAAGAADVRLHPPPAAFFTGFDDRGLRFELQVWTGRVDRKPKVQSDVGIAVYAALRDAGMSLAVPQQEIRVQRSETKAP